MFIFICLTHQITKPPATRQPSSCREKLLLGKRCAYLVRHPLEHLVQRSLHQRNQILGKQHEILIDRLVDGVAQQSIAAKQIVQPDAAILQLDDRRDFFHANVIDAVDRFGAEYYRIATVNIHCGQRREQHTTHCSTLLLTIQSQGSIQLTKFPIKFARTANRQQQNLTIDRVVASHVHCLEGNVELVDAAMFYNTAVRSIVLVDSFVIIMFRAIVSHPLRPKDMHYIHTSTLCTYFMSTTRNCDAL